ncbi:hypothetical protein HK104_010832 [Borealophlyctis nickersoniae]|nr:hypothetical protein HK104_010832 [Borealophlyctis nickersoniae]
MQTGTVYSSTLLSLLCPHTGSESPSNSLSPGSSSNRNDARPRSDLLEWEDGLLSERYLAKGKHTFVPTPSANLVRFDVNFSDVERDGGQLAGYTDASPAHPAVDNTYCGRVALNFPITERAYGQQILESILNHFDVEGRHPQWKVSVDFGPENVKDGETAAMRVLAPNPGSATPSWLPILSVPVGPVYPVPAAGKRKGAPSKVCSTLLEALYRAHASGMCVFSAIAEIQFSDAGLDLNVGIRVWLTPHAFKDSCEAATSANISIETYDLFRLMYPTEGVKNDAVADILGTLVLSEYPVNDQDQTLQPPNLFPTLLNFQRSAVAWMLGREGVMSDGQGNLVRKGESQSQADGIPLLCRKITTDLGNHFLVNDLTGAVGLSEENIANDNEKEVLGGILADEMGLGKTVMLLALILLHRPSSTSCPPVNPSTLPVTSAASTTDLLIPSSCTLVITPSAILNQWGSEISTHAPDVEVFLYEGVQAHSDLDSQALANFDVVLTTYDILKKELPYAVKPPDRARRSERKYEAKRSPLVEIQWWRVVLDEAQMIESSVPQAGEMARIIPRVHPWAVTGTPIGKNGRSDLHHSIRFLDLKPLSDTTFWERIESPTHVPTFLSVFRRIMHRNRKKNVKNELNLPPKTEEVVLLDFSKVEQRHYDDMWDQCLEEINALESGGSRWLDEDLVSLEHGLFRTKIYRAQMYEFQEQYAAALEIYQPLLKDIRARVAAAEEELQAAESGMREPLAPVDAQNSRDADEENIGDTAAGAEKGNDVDNDPSDDLGTLTSRLRAWQELEHRLLFFIASANQSVTNGLAEIVYYALAEKVRRRILAPDEDEIEILLSKLEQRIDDTWRTVCSDGGMLMTKVKHPGRNKTIAAIKKVVDKLNKQWEMMAEWRERIVKALVPTLEDAEGGGHEKKGDEPAATGEEYGIGLKFAEEGFECQEICKEFLNDRRELLTGWRVNQSNANLVDAAVWNPDAKAKAALHEKSEKLRKPFMLPEGAMHLKSLLAELKKITKKEKIKMCETLSIVGKEFDTQIVNLGVLEKEMAEFRRMYNSRLVYYRRLQFISDGITPPNKPVNIEAAIERYLEDEAATEQMLATQIGRKRYLENLMAEENEKLNCERKERQRECVICSIDFEKGVVTLCGHIYCSADCLKVWIEEHKTCPTCQQPCHLNEVTAVSFKDYSSASSSPSPSTSFLTDLQSIKISGSFGTKLDTIIRHIRHIRSTDPTAKALVFSRWGQVLDILGQGLTENDLQWVKLEGGSGAKAKGKGDAVIRFREDPEIAVFMLNARSQAAGLSLVAATHVFLVEPSVNVGLEAQESIASDNANRPSFGGISSAVRSKNASASLETGTRLEALHPLWEKTDWKAGPQAAGKSSTSDQWSGVYSDGTVMAPDIEMDDEALM